MPVAIQFYIQPQFFCDQNKPLLADMKNKSVCEGKKLKQFPLCKAPGSDNKRRRRCWRENRLMHKAKKLHSFSTSNLSVHLTPRKAASLGVTEPGETFVHCFGPCSPQAVWSPSVPPLPPGGQISFSRGTDTWVPLCMCSPDIAGPQFGPGDEKGFWVLHVSCSWRDSTRN